MSDGTAGRQTGGAWSLDEIKRDGCGGGVAAGGLAYETVILS